MQVRGTRQEGTTTRKRRREKDGKGSRNTREAAGGEQPEGEEEGQQEGEEQPTRGPRTRADAPDGFGRPSGATLAPVEGSRRGTTAGEQSGPPAPRPT